MKLIIDPATGLSGDMFIAALLDAGSRLAGRRELVARVTEAMRFAGGLLGKSEVTANKTRQGTRLSVRLERNEQSLPARRLEKILEEVLRAFDFSKPEREFAGRAFAVLRRAEEEAHHGIENRKEHHHHVPGRSHAVEAHLHEAQDILVDIAGSALALGLLHVVIDDVVCLSPVHYGGGTVTFSHGTFTVPAPAVDVILQSYRIPSQVGPVMKELLTPTGAALLAALRPRYRPRSVDWGEVFPNAVTGVGLGTLEFENAEDLINALIVYLIDE